MLFVFLHCKFSALPQRRYSDEGKRKKITHLVTCITVPEATDTYKWQNLLILQCALNQYMIFAIVSNDMYGGILSQHSFIKEYRKNLYFFAPSFSYTQLCPSAFVDDDSDSNDNETFIDQKLLCRDQTKISKRYIFAKGLWNIWINFDQLFTKFFFSFLVYIYTH